MDTRVEPVSSRAKIKTFRSLMGMAISTLRIILGNDNTNFVLALYLAADCFEEDVRPEGRLPIFHTRLCTRVVGFAQPAFP